MSRYEFKPELHIPGHGIAGTLAALDFAKRLAAAHGTASGEDVDRLRRAGYNDHEISEIVSAVRAGHPMAPGGASGVGESAEPGTSPAPEGRGREDL